MKWRNVKVKSKSSLCIGLHKFHGLNSPWLDGNKLNEWRRVFCIEAATELFTNYYTKCIGIAIRQCKWVYIRFNVKSENMTNTSYKVISLTWAYCDWRTCVFVTRHWFCNQGMSWDYVNMIVTNFYNQCVDYIESWYRSLWHVHHHCGYLMVLGGRNGPLCHIRQLRWYWGNDINTQILKEAALTDICNIYRKLNLKNASKYQLNVHILQSFHFSFRLHDWMRNWIVLLKYHLTNRKMASESNFWQGKYFTNRYFSSLCQYQWVPLWNIYMQVQF